MTWSLNHTITYVDTSSYGTMWTYLADTVLPAKGFTVAAGDDAFSRFVQTDFVNGWTGGTETVGWFMDWTSATNASVKFQWDHVRDGSTGHLSTSYQQGGRTLDPADIKFWYSDQSNGVLVTCSREVIFYWPGTASDGVEVYPYGTSQAPVNGSTLFYPWVTVNWYYTGAPVSTTPGTINYMSGWFQQASSIAPASGAGLLKMTAPLVSFGSQQAPYGPGIKIPFNDVALVTPSTRSSTYYAGFRWVNSSTGIATDGSNYHIASSDLSSNYTSVWFNCGTTSPNY